MKKNRFTRDSANKSKSRRFNSPEALIALDYDSIYGNEGAKDSIADCLKDVPSVVVLHYVLTKHWPLHFAMNSLQLHREPINDLRRSLPKQYRCNLNSNIRKNKSILFNSQSTMHICYETLRNYVSMDKYEDTDITPSDEELEQIYRAYLKCNSYWTGKQKLSDDLIDLSLGIEVPFIEFKNHKKFLTAVYKSVKFFEYCENTSPYDSYLKNLLLDLGLIDWHEYIVLFVDLYSLIINKPYIHFDKSTEYAYNFFRQFTINVKELMQLGEWDGNLSIKYLRDHFLVDFDKDVLLALSPDFVCDKLYQGLKFMMWSSIQKHKLTQPNGKSFDSIAGFLGLLGQDFSEKHLISEVLYKALAGHVDSIYTDDDIKGANILSPSDFYIKKGNMLIVIEYKDSLFPDNIKHSDNLDKIKEEIKKKICLDEAKDSTGTKRNLKGVGQLLDTIVRIAKGEYSKFDTSYDEIRIVLPVVVTTDISFSALGVNSYVIQQTNDMIKRHNEVLKDSNIFTAVPTIIDIDTLIDISYLLHQGQCNLFDLILKFIKQNELNIQSFRVFIEDMIIRHKEISEQELSFLLPKFNCF